MIRSRNGYPIINEILLIPLFSKELESMTSIEVVDSGFSICKSSRIGRQVNHNEKHFGFGEQVGPPPSGEF